MGQQISTESSTELHTSDAFSDLLLTVLRHASWRERGAALAVCRTWRQRLLRGDHYYKFLCDRLHAEHLLYAPTDSVCTHAGGWRALFLELWPRRRTWSAPGDGEHLHWLRRALEARHGLLCAAGAQVQWHLHAPLL